MAFTSGLAVTPTLNYADRYLNGRPIDCCFISSRPPILLTIGGLNSPAGLGPLEQIGNSATVRTHRLVFPHGRLPRVCSACSFRCLRSGLADRGAAQKRGQSPIAGSAISGLCDPAVTLGRVGRS